MKKPCYYLLCLAWVAGFVCLMYHTFTVDGLEVIPTLTAYALFLISAVLCCSCCNKDGCCKKEE
tara:strand:+ start:554 stop:745 length:192 start_codon:yes stop_codon:yes gene_type:complete